MTWIVLLIWAATTVAAVIHHRRVSREWQRHHALMRLLEAEIDRLRRAA